MQASLLLLLPAPYHGRYRCLGGRLSQPPGSEVIPQIAGSDVHDGARLSEAFDIFEKDRLSHEPAELALDDVWQQRQLARPLDCVC